jgi:8-oxo-dGTP pyrophosphatase MutT (NUDIX family)
VVVVQYRPPIDAYTIEFPSGCVDKNESNAVLSALRELKEETGFVGSNAKMEYTMAYEPSIINSCGQMIRCNVDLDDPRNQNPQPQLEDDEFSLKTFMLPLTDLHAKLMGSYFRARPNCVS